MAQIKIIGLAKEEALISFMLKHLKRHIISLNYHQYIKVFT
jgi:hypothetical protein